MIRIYTTGVFDLFHIGHLRALRKAESLGDYLLVGVRNDLDASDYKRHPVIPFEQRVEIVSAIDCVDEVIVDEVIVDEVIVDEVIKGPLSSSRQFYQ